MALGAVPGRRDRATGRTSFGVGLSAGLFPLLFPFLVGAPADVSSTHAAFIVVPALATLSVLLLVAAGRRRRPVGLPRPQDG